MVIKFVRFGADSCGRLKNAGGTTELAECTAAKGEVMPVEKERKPGETRGEARKADPNIIGRVYNIRRGSQAGGGGKKANRNSWEGAQG